MLVLWTWALFKKKINSTNWSRHVNSCKKKFKGCNKSLDTLSFFIKTTNKPSTSGEYLIYNFFVQYSNFIFPILWMIEINSIFLTPIYI